MPGGSNPMGNKVYIGDTGRQICIIYIPENIEFLGLKSLIAANKKSLTQKFSTAEDSTLTMVRGVPNH